MMTSILQKVNAHQTGHLATKLENCINNQRAEMALKQSQSQATQSAETSCKEDAA